MAKQNKSKKKKRPAPQAPAAVPNTGDATSPVLPLAIGACALAAACAALLLVRRNNR